MKLEQIPTSSLTSVLCFLSNKCHIFCYLVSQLCPTLWHHRLQHTRPACPSSSPEVCPSSCPLHWWCHAVTSSFYFLFFCPQSFSASGTFPMSRLFTSGDQSTGASASASVLPVSIQGWFPLRLTGLISLLSKGLAGVFSSTSLKASVLWLSAFLMVQPMEEIQRKMKWASVCLQPSSSEFSSYYYYYIIIKVIWYKIL